MPSAERFYKVGGVVAIAGAVILLVATLLHPAGAHPSDAPAAFAEYAADRYWVVTHLGQLLGVDLICVGLVSLSWRLRKGGAGVWAVLGAVGATASLAIAGAIQAVDGVALKLMVDRWLQAAPESRSPIFEASFAVRQVEIGLASMMGLFFGLTAMLYGVALWSGRERPIWLGWLGLVGGAATMAAGAVQAHDGFSDLAMMLTMPSGLLLMLWTGLVGMFLLRTRRLDSDATSPT